MNIKNLFFKTNEQPVVESNISPKQVTTDKTIQPTQKEPSYSIEFLEKLEKELRTKESSMSFNYFSFKDTLMNSELIATIPDLKTRFTTVVNTLKLTNSNIDKEFILQALSSAQEGLQELETIFYDESKQKFDETVQNKLDEIANLEESIVNLNQELLDKSDRVEKLKVEADKAKKVFEDKFLPFKASFERLKTILETDRNSLAKL